MRLKLCTGRLWPQSVQSSDGLLKLAYSYSGVTSIASSVTILWFPLVVSELGRGTTNADHALKERVEEGNESLNVLAERIIDKLSTGQVNSKKIATDLGTSQRTLTRRLSEHNISFDQLIDNIRQDLAMRYLDEGNVKLQNLAFLLNFSSHASFSAAFKRWTGKTLTKMKASS